MKKQGNNKRGVKPVQSIEASLMRKSALVAALQCTIAAMAAGSMVYVPSAAAADTSELAEATNAGTNRATLDYSIAPGPLAQALPAFAARAGIPLSFDASLLAGKQTAGLSGTYSVEQGFARLLRSTGLEAERLPGGGYTVKTIAADAGRSAGELQPIEISGQRTTSDLIRPTRQSNVIGREELNELRQSSDSLATVLGKIVPGMADSSHTITDYGQTLRGRNTLVLVDGIPLNTNRDSSRNMATLNLASIDKVEVLRGSSAIYGAGAAGGIIAVTTRPAGGEPYAETSFTLKSALSHLGSDGLGGEVNHYMSGTKGPVDYAFNLGYQHVGGSFDGKGNRIAPEPSQGDLFDSDNYTVGGKLGFRIDRNQRLQLSVSRYVAEQDSRYGSDPAVARVAAGSTVARPLDGLQLADQNQIRNTLVSLDYQNQDVFGSQLSTQLYYRDYFTRFTPFDARAVSTRGNNVDQVMQNSRVLGARATLTTPLADNTKLLWGLDFNQERSDMPDDVFDPAAYDASGGTVFRRTGTLIYMPLLTTRSIGGFGQLQHKFSDKWSVEAGVRYERAYASYDDFIPLSQSRVASPQAVRGGSVSFGSWMSNAGVVFKPVAGHEVYASFSQGFQLPDIGLQIRNATPAFNISSSALEPVKTNSYEIGWRGAMGNVLGNLAVFHTTSKLGDVQSFNNGLILTRTAEKITGIEAGADYLPDDSAWGGGATWTMMWGRETPQGSTSDQIMSGYRIPPMKVTAYLQYKPDARWSNRLQATYFASRDYRLRGQTAFGRQQVGSYTTVDLVSRYQLTDKDAVSLGIENLLNRYYIPAYSQLMRNSNNTSRLPGAGAVMSLTYSHRW